ncbi:MAG: hypothetical protein KBE65_12140 [Phycisphaerae bacterium]|nr:hypothetical protein [Phycisphaerae bacterium]
MKVKTAVFSLAAVLCLLTAGGAWGKVIYVDGDAPPGGDGISWITAYRFLQDALTDAKAAGEAVEIRVAQGTYKPDRSSAHPDGTRDRSASFVLLDDVAIKGGFPGIGAPDPDARDIALYETILSGDLTGDDAPVRDPCHLLTEPTRAENSYAVVRAGACSRSAVLDGFTVASGNAMGGRVAGGGGLYLSGTAEADCCPSIENCTFLGNLAASGGAVVVKSAYPEFTACTFLQNATKQMGGAMLIRLSGSPSSPCEFVLRDCVFAGNLAGTEGGAIFGWNWPSVIEDCSFMGNHAQRGGAIYNLGPGDPANAVNCCFIGNMADVAGGVVYFRYKEGVTMTSCTLAGNTAPAGRAIACLESVNELIPDPSAMIINTILWDGGDEIGVSDHVQVYVSYSDVYGGWPREGNIDLDPLFASPAYWDPNGTDDDPNDDFWVDGDYHLKSQAGRWDPNSGSWVQDDVTSSCIDAGDPNSPIGDEPFPNGGRVNMGAYGGTAEASKSYAED